jgi:hypothetical protein
MVRDRRESHCKDDESTDIGIQGFHRFPGMLAKALRTLAEVCHCPGELLRQNAV